MLRKRRLGDEGSRWQRGTLDRWLLPLATFLALPFATKAAIWPGEDFLDLDLGGSGGVTAVDKRMGPVFLSEPPSRVDFLNTTGASIDCLAYGQPGARVGWLLARDGSPVGPVPGLRHVLPNGTLVLWPFRPERYRQDVHAEVYRCRATNAVGTVVSRDVHVRGVVRQYYDVQVYDEYVIRGNTAVLTCHIPSFVRDFVSVTAWIRDDVLTITSTSQEGGRYSVFPSGEFHIRNVTPGDGSMSYRCQTSHRLTQEIVVSASAGRLIVTDSSGTVPPRVTDSRAGVVAVQGEAVELPCAAQGFPVPKYSWFKYPGRPNASSSSSSPSGGLHSQTPIPVYLDPRMVQLSGSLLIRQVALEDAGNYVCIISNSAGEERLELQLVVNAPLSAHIQPQQQTVDVGRPARFNCSHSGHPVTQVVWLKDGRPVRSDNRRLWVSGTLLSIAAVQREDGGMYQCVVSNEEESAQGSAQLLLGDAAPVFHSVFSEETVQPGPFVSLRCVASGSPLPQITWTLDGGPLPLDDPRLRVGDYITPQGRVVSYVNVTSARTEDGGEYACEARSAAGSVRHASRLNVFGPPSVRPMPDVSAVSGEALTLRCHVSGHPIEPIAWSRDGNRLPITRRQEVFPNGTLVIRDVQRGVDNGVYKCRVWNQQGQSASGTVRVHVMVKPVIDPFSFPRHLQEGMRARLVCTVIQGDPPFVVRWRKDGRPIEPGLGVVVRDDTDFSSDLTFASVTPAHNGNYTCTVSNAAAAVSHTALLVVDVPPRWRVEPQDTSVIAGQNVRMDCLADGYPTPVVTWERGSGSAPRHYVAIASGPHYEVYANGSLLIKHVQESDGGYYLCQASNGIAAGLSKVVFLTVQVPPRFETKFRSETVRRGDAVRLRCEAEGDHPMTITWTVDKQPLSPSDDPRYEVKEQVDKKRMSSEIQILAAERRDSALFTCLVNNAFGRDDMNIRLIVQEPPEPPRELRTTEVKSRMAKISWPPPYTGNSPILRYHVHCRPHRESGSWEEGGQHQQHHHNATITTAGTEETSYVLRGLRPARAYVCRVWAENQIGVGEPSDPLPFTTLEEVPGGPPLDVRAEPVDSSTIRVTWKPPERELWNGPIKGYYVGYKVYDSEDSYLYKTLEVGGRMAQEVGEEVLLAHLQKYTRYSVLVQAYNAMGAGPRSDEVLVRTLEDVPSESPKDVQCLPVSSQSLHVAWEPPSPSAVHGILQGYRVFVRPVLKASSSPVLPSSSHFLPRPGEELSWNSSEHDVKLTGLRKHANYSVSVAAYTQKGAGERSPPVFCQTLEDVPGPPADLKAVVLSSDTILLRWRPPHHPNGVITKYSLYWRRLGNGPKNATVVHVQPNLHQYKVSELAESSRHEFWLTASTSRGEGQPTKVVSQTPTERVPGRVVDFGLPLVTIPGDKAVMHCQAAGIPAPEREWKFGTEAVPKTYRHEVTPEGSLIIRKLQLQDSGNYTCYVQNKHGADEITYSLSVKESPSNSQLKVLNTTPSSVLLELPSSVAHVFKEYEVHYKAEGREWQQKRVPGRNHTWRLEGLECGTRYQLYVIPLEEGGPVGERSGPVTFKTQGTAPVAAKQEDVVSSNTTHLLLHIGAWQSGGCPLLSLSVEYRPHSRTHWTSLLRGGSGDPLAAFTQRPVVVEVVPDTWYVVRVSARNAVGVTTTEYDVITMTPAGEAGNHLPSTTSFLEDTTTLVSMASSGVVLIAGIVAVVCLVMYKRRRNTRHHYRGVSSSAILAESSSSRSDVATTTALMAHLEKKAGGGGVQQSGPPSSRRDLPSYFSSPVRKVAPAGGGRSQAPPVTGASSHSSSARQTRSDQTTEYEEEIAPYATFQLPGPSTEDDLCNLEEFKTFSVRHGEPPYLIRSSLDPPSCKSGKVSEEFYQCHAPNSHSLTSGSSNQEELLRAYDYARRHPPPPLLHYDSSSQWGENKTSGGTATTESEGTDPGIRQFSGTPPLPNERRQGACLTPGNSVGVTPQNDSSSTSGDTTPVNPVGLSVALPPRERRSSKLRPVQPRKSAKGIKKGAVK